MPTRIPFVALVEDVMNAGLADPITAELALHATVATLGARLTYDEANALSARLPEQLARILDDCEYEGDFDATELYERVARRANVPTRIAREEVDIVLRVLGERIDEELRQRLARALPHPIALRFQPSDVAESPPHWPVAHAPTSTLAAGRPGSRHPLSEAAPSSGHTHSVAQNDNPHEETKLSSSHGLTQERFDETLATGRPPKPARPVT